MKPTRRMLVAMLALLAMLLAACGDDDGGGVASSGDVATTSDDVPEDDSSAEETPGSFPVTVSSGGVDTTVDSRPEAIVSLSPSITEMLFAIGAGDQVVAVDEYSTHPPEAPTTELSGYEPNIEAIIGYEPDLVVLDASRDDLLAGLGAVDVPVLVAPAPTELAQTYEQLELLGAVTGNADGAAELVATMRSDIEELVSRVPDREEPLTYYHELDPLLYTVTSDTFIGELYALAGLDNVADPADADGAASGYPQLSGEFLLEADPDVIFLADADCCDQDAAAVAARPGWDRLRAVTEGRIVELDEDIASRWGPRVVDFLETIVDATADITAR